MTDDTKNLVTACEAIEAISPRMRKKSLDYLWELFGDKKAAPDAAQSPVQEEGGGAWPEEQLSKVAAKVGRRRKGSKATRG